MSDQLTKLQSNVVGLKARLTRLRKQRDNEKDQNKLKLITEIGVQTIQELNDAVQQLKLYGNQENPSKPAKV